MIIHPLWFICLIVRLSIIYFIWFFLRDKSKVKNKTIFKNLILIILFVIGLGFIRQGYFGSNYEIQVAKVFWHETRYIHGTLYLLSGLYLFFNNLNMCLLLLGLDIVFSLMYRIIFNK